MVFVFTGISYPNANAWGSDGKIHPALMGDPTLRMDIVKPPKNVKQTVSGGTVTITWTASDDAAVARFKGYQVYRASTWAGPFTKISGGTPLTGTSFRRR